VTITFEKPIVGLLVDEVDGIVIQALISDTHRVEVVDSSLVYSGIDSRFPTPSSVIVLFEGPLSTMLVHFAAPGGVLPDTDLTVGFSAPIIPEPSAAMIFAIGLLSAGVWSRRR
jgi:hypothetical protein